RTGTGSQVGSDLLILQHTHPERSVEPLIIVTPTAPDTRTAAAVGRFRPDRLWEQTREALLKFPPPAIPRIELWAHRINVGEVPVVHKPKAVGQPERVADRRQERRNRMGSYVDHVLRFEEKV